MMNSSDLTKKLSLLGLNNKQSQIYLELLKGDTLTPLELSRASKINRSTIYRVLEELKELGLVEELLDQHRIKARAVNPEKLELLISQKESELKKIKESLPETVSQLSAIQGQPSAGTKVAYFKGKKGLQQMMWNVLKAKEEHLGFGYSDWNEWLGESFAEKLRQEVVDRNILSREIQNEESVSKISTYTKVANYEEFYECRSLTKSLIEINHDTYIYNDVFAFSYFYKGELFGVEIHNKEIAKTQKQIFEVMWKIANKT